MQKWRALFRVVLGSNTLWKPAPSRRQHNTEHITLTLSNMYNEENKNRFSSRLKDVSELRTGKHLRKQSLTVKQSAVLVPFCLVDGAPSILFMLRSNTLSSHRGEVSFPGGMADSTDTGLIHTAIRETYEEVGIPEREVDIWGQMKAIPSKSDGSVLVTPVVGYCGEVNISDLYINTNEVESVFTRSIQSLCDRDNTRYTQYRSGKGYTMPVFLGGNHRIWGLTAIVLYQTMIVLCPELFTYRHKHRS